MYSLLFKHIVAGLYSIVVGILFLFLKRNQRLCVWLCKEIDRRLLSGSFLFKNFFLSSSHFTPKIINRIWFVLLFALPRNLLLNFLLTKLKLLRLFIISLVIFLLLLNWSSFKKVKLLRLLLLGCLLKVKLLKLLLLLLVWLLDILLFGLGIFENKSFFYLRLSMQVSERYVVNP